MRKKTALLILFLITLPAVWNILTPGYFPIHDATQVVRVSQLTKSLTDLHFPVRWVKDLGYGYGYPIFNFYNPLPYYFGSLFNLLHLKALYAAKAMFIFPVFLAAAGMFLLTRKLLGDFAAIVAASFYTYAPYHAVQIYVRGSVAEYWAYAFMPFMLLYLFNRKTILSAVSISWLILSHNLTSFMAIIPIAFVFLIQLFIERNKLLLFKRYLLITVLALGFSAFFWLPALAEKHFTQVDQMVAESFTAPDHLVFPRQLWSAPWGYGGSAPGEADGLSFQLGKLHIIFSLIAVLLFKKIWPQRALRPLYLFSLITLLFSLFMLSPPSRFIWENLSILAFLQFPWRYLSFTALTASILAGILTRIILVRRNKFILVSYILLLAAFSAISAKYYFKPLQKYGPDINSSFLLSADRVKFEVSARSDEYRPQGAQVPQSLDQIHTRRYQINLEAGESVQVSESKTQIFRLSTSLINPKTLTLNIYSFPGWQVFIDNIKVTHQTTPDTKLITINVPAGSHTLTAKFLNTPIRNLANLISLTTLLSLILLLILSKRKTKK